MFDYNKMNTDAKVFFDSMPGFIQENIAQSGMEFTNRQELEAYCDNMLRNGSGRKQS